MRKLSLAGLCLVLVTSLANQAPQAAVPPAPDYALARNWAATARHEGAAATVAPGASPKAVHPRADVFYIHPTTDKSAERWNTPVDDASVNAWTDASVVARQAGIFNGCCRVFAPRYRQATAGTSKAGGTVREDAMALAYGDVLRAFRYYLAHWNHGRPFILVGHSQGAAHLERLLAEEIDGKPLRDRLVAAYVVGISLPAERFAGSGASLTICGRPDSTGCVVHWSSVLASADIAKAVQTAEDYNRAHLPAGRAPGVLCVNPLTFDKARDGAPAAAAQGAVPGAPDAGPIRTIEPAAVAAHCDRGLLVVEPDARLELTPLPGGSMHYHDLGLFYADVRENAKTRVAAWWAARNKRRSR